MIRWWWVRHAPSRAPKGAMIGWTDAAADLSDTGALSRRAASLPKNVSNGGAMLVTSDLARARATAAALDLGEGRVEPGLREVHFGAWEGQRFDQIPAAALPALTRFLDGDGPAPGGESFGDVVDRVAKTCAEIAQRAQQQAMTDIIAVAHAGAIRAALAIALDLAPKRAQSFAIDPLSLTRIDQIDGGWRVGGVNLPA